LKELNNDLARELLTRIARGDEAALKVLHGHLGRRIYAFALNRLHDESEADAVVTDTLWEVWKHPTRFSGTSKFSTWVLGIARNKILTALRDRAPMSEELDEELPTEDLGPFEQWQRQREGQAIRRCMDGLSDAHRECVQLVFFQDLSIAEVAQVQQCPENTVKTRLFHARSNLKKCLEGLAGAKPGPQGNTK
jgi:RNA polymerase sigma-70 factor, ECF subfamily